MVDTQSNGNPSGPKSPKTSLNSAVPTQAENASEDDDPPGGKQLLPHVVDYQTLTNSLKSNISNGLDPNEAQYRLTIYGHNILQAEDGPSALKVLFRQLANALSLILLATMALSFGVQDWVEGGVIAAIIALNVIVGFFQEYKAERTMASLRTLSTPTANVIRGGQTLTIDSKDLVPGDIILVNSGDRAPADARLISVTNLECDEAILTGESVPVAKQSDPIPDPENELSPGDCINLIYGSTMCTTGRATAIVFATGMNSEFGKIAQSLSAKKNEDLNVWQKFVHGALTWLGLRGVTPLQKKMAQLAYILLGIAIILAIVVFASATFDISDQVVLYAIALGIGVIPESLIAVLTVTMALGTKRMAQSNVIVRKLDALEALGGVTDICSDKTGTITQGKMIVKHVWLPSLGNYVLDTSGGQLDLSGKVFFTGEKNDQEPQPLNIEKDVPNPLRLLVSTAGLCNLAMVNIDDKGDKTANGDPTEIALQVLAHKLDLNRTKLVYSTLNPDKDESLGIYELMEEFPFSSDIKRMATVFRDNRSQTPIDKRITVFQKGAVEKILECCTSVVTTTSDSNPAPLDEINRKSILAQVERLAEDGLRVIALAYKHEQENHDQNHKRTREETESNMAFLGLAGLEDPPRPESAGAVAACKEASIRVRMLTGDHPLTASNIARQVGILENTSPASAVMTAHTFDSLLDHEIDQLPELPYVIARCTPNTKVRMLEACQRREFYVAMTGDGVNDAPALRNADIGVAMGSGSDISKGAADLTLLDDNFASIVAAVCEGRRTFDNIQRFIVALIVGNVSEVILLMIGLAFLDPNDSSVFPLSPLAILWVNMVTASPPALGLGLEPADPAVMKRPPHDLKKGVFSWAIISDIFFYGSVSGITCLFTFVIIVYGPGLGRLGVNCNDTLDTCSPDVASARSAVFATLTFQLLLVTWETKSISRSVFNLIPGQSFWKPWWDNQVLFWSVIIGMLIVPICIYVPVFNESVFRQGPIDFEWGIIIGFTIVFIAAIELWKALLRRNSFGIFGKVDDDVELGIPGANAVEKVHSAPNANSDSSSESDTALSNTVNSSQPVSYKESK